MKRRTTLAGCLAFIICICFSSVATAQTTYNSEEGVFVNPLQSLHLEQDTFGFTYVLGPAVGYRVNQNFDVALHPEFLLSKYEPNNSRSSLLNLGIIGGYTTPISERLSLRSELALYKVFEFEGNFSRETRFLNTGLVSSSLYWEVPLFKSVSFIPNIGAVAGYGADTLPPNIVSSHLLTNDFEGFAYGPRLGLDIKFNFSEDFSLIVSPTARMFYNQDKLTIIGLNFKFNF